MTSIISCYDYKRYLTCTLQRVTGLHSLHLPLGFPKEIPQLTIPDFLNHLYKHLHCSPSVYICMVVLLDRYLAAAKPHVTLNEGTIRALVLVASVIAIKYEEDDYYTNSYYAHVGGMSLAELNVLERLMLGSLQFSVHISESEYFRYANYALNHISSCVECLQSLSLCRVPEANPRSVPNSAELVQTWCEKETSNCSTPPTPSKPNKRPCSQSESLKD